MFTQKRQKDNLDTLQPIKRVKQEISDIQTILLPKEYKLILLDPTHIEKLITIFPNEVPEKLLFSTINMGITNVNINSIQETNFAIGLNYNDGISNTLVQVALLTIDKNHEKYIGFDFTIFDCKTGKAFIVESNELEDDYFESIDETTKSFLKELIAQLKIVGLTNDFTNFLNNFKIPYSSILNDIELFRANESDSKLESINYNLLVIKHKPSILDPKKNIINIELTEDLKKCLPTGVRLIQPGFQQMQILTSYIPNMPIQHISCILENKPIDFEDRIFNAVALQEISSGKIIGSLFYILNKNNQILEIQSLEVEKNFRKKGFGSLLLLLILNQQINCKLTILETTDDGFHMYDNYKFLPLEILYYAYKKSNKDQGLVNLLVENFKPQLSLASSSVDEWENLSHDKKYDKIKKGSSMSDKYHLGLNLNDPNTQNSLKQSLFNLATKNTLIADSNSLLFFANQALNSNKSELIDTHSKISIWH